MRGKSILYLIVIFLIFIVSSYKVNAKQGKYIGSWQIQEYNSQLVSDVNYDYYDFIDTKDNYQKLFMASFNPSSTDVEMVLHDVFPGNGTYSSATVLDIAKNYEKKYGRKVYAAVNGDFFWQGEPIDYYIKEGQIVHEGTYMGKVSFGFNSNGEYSIGRPISKPMLRIYDNNNKYEDVIINKLDGQLPWNKEISIYRPGQTMETIETGKYLIKANLETIENEFTLPLVGTVDRPEIGDLVTNEKIVVPEGYFGIAINAITGINEKAQTLYDKLNHNNKVEVFNSPGGDFKGMTWGIGGYNKLVVDRVVMPEELKLNSGGNSYAPRTTIGVMEDGRFFISVVDGRQGTYSNGITVPQQAQLAYDLGAKTALELDGGGSSTFVLRVNDQLTVMNNPSDGNLRRVSNAVLLVEKEEVIDDSDNIDNPDDNQENNTEEVSVSSELPIITTSLVLISMIVYGATYYIVRKK